MSTAGFEPIEKLAANHDVASFDCGSEPLNRFLRRFALANQRADNSQTYVLCSDGRRVIGYHSLTVGSVEHGVAPERIGRGQPRHPIPVMLLARLAVQHTEQRRGLGRGLLKDALLRTAQAADIAGIRALLVHAKDEVARAWYTKVDFEPSPTDPLHLFLLMKDLRLALGS